ncbi:MAG: helicase-associated domain-containing protein [Planctomycetota bacterium]
MASRRDGPLIVQGDRSVLLDLHHPRAEEARDRLSSFAELLKTPDHLHTYRITPISLWNAAAAGLRRETVLETLEELARNPLPSAVREEIDEVMRRFGGLVLRRDEAHRLRLQVSEELWDRVRGLAVIAELVEVYDDGARELVVHEAQRGEIKRALTRAGFPVEDLAGYLEGDAFEIELATGVAVDGNFALRPYQREAAEAFYQDGDRRGGSGVIVMPCGAGKTVTAMAVMSLYRTKTLVLTNSTTAVRQWIREILEKTGLDPDDVAEYSSESKRIAPVTVSTYQMMTWRSTKIGGYPHFEAFMRENWGLVVYDEVHLLPAPVFRMTAEVQARRRLGLTATLVREDGREDEVFSLIGPKRYDMPWRRLEQRGFIAAAQLVELRVPLARSKMYAYEEADNRDRYRIAAENPLKLRALTEILERHRGDRVLVIGMYLRQLATIRALIGCPLITSRTPQEEREELYRAFREGEIDVLAVSKVANFAIDLPDANIAIQVSGTYGSRQEEAQRLGRILRPKSHDRDTVFYTLVTEDTRETRFAENRRLFLTEQGYDYRVEDVRRVFPRADWTDAENELADAPRPSQERDA